jgi:predicted ATP-grasp superfamily ATP-dependent carboligase
MQGAAAGTPAILLGGTGTTLAVTRALGQAGIPVVILGDGRNDIVARRSRYCGHYEHFGDAGALGPAAIGAEWLTWLERRSSPSVVLPCSDIGLELVARHRHRIEAAGHRASEADDAVVLAMLDKEQTYRLASADGIRVPRTAQVTSMSAAYETIDDDIGLPCAVKPVRSDRVALALPGYSSPKGTLVRDRHSLRAAVEPVVAIGEPMLVSEFVPGPDAAFCSYYSYIDEHGVPLFDFTKRKLRQYPPLFGGGTYHVTEWMPDVAECGRRFFAAVGLRGLGNVEFKRDMRDGGLVLIECNARFTMATGQVRRAGIDLALVVYNRVVGAPLPSLGNFADGVRLWYPTLDFKAFRRYRADGALTASSWVKSLLHRQHFSVFDWRDPAPLATAVRGRLRRAGPEIP